MAEIVKCPNCNAQLVNSGNGLIKCEYCDTEIITDNPIHLLPYAEKKKEWNKSLKTSLIIQACGMFLTSMFAVYNSALCVLFCIASVIFSFVMPARLLKKKPLSESEKINSTLVNYIKTYATFAGAFWAGLAIEVFIENLL